MGAHSQPEPPRRASRRSFDEWDHSTSAPRSPQPARRRTNYPRAQSTPSRRHAQQSQSRPTSSAKAVPAQNTEASRTGRATGHDFTRIMIECGILALCTAIAIGGLSWAADRLVLKFFVDSYDPAMAGLYVMSAVISLCAVMLATLMFVGLDRVSGIAKGLFFALLWVIVLTALAVLWLTSFSVYSVVYVVLLVGIVVGLSYVPGIVSGNRIVR